MSLSFVPVVNDKAMLEGFWQSAKFTCACLWLLCKCTRWQQHCLCHIQPNVLHLLCLCSGIWSGRSHWLILG